MNFFFTRHEWEIYVLKRAIGFLEHHSWITQKYQLKKLAYRRFTEFQVLLAIALAGPDQMILQVL